MIVYTQIETLARDLGVCARTLYALSNAPQRHYHKAVLRKKDGGTRTLLVPDEPTKIVQRAILSNLLAYEPVSPAAAAYRPAFGPERGARLHVGAKKVLTLDVRGFFDHIRYPDVKNCAFPKERYSEALRVLLARLCCPFESLPQGAPTSPAISNLVMREFDETMLSYCAARGIAYSRYCDDMTFSGDFDAGELAKFAADLLGARGMTLNRKKTRVRTNAQRQRVTGLVVNERVRTDRDYRRALRQELYYCQKYGIEAHAARKNITGGAENYARSLLGRVTRALSFEAGDAALAHGRAFLVNYLTPENLTSENLTSENAEG